MDSVTISMIATLDGKEAPPSKPNFRMTILLSSQQGSCLAKSLGVLAVIALVGIIAAPKLAARTELKQQELCISNLRQLAAAIESWAHDNQKTDDQLVTYNDIRRYLRDDVVCPSAPVEMQSPTASYVLGLVGEGPRCAIRPATHKLEDRRP